MSRLEEEFFRIYGYRGDFDELREFKSEQGYDIFGDYSDNNYGSSNSRKQEYTSNDESEAGDVSSEFSGLFKDILGQAKTHKGQSSEGMNEFALMALLFVTKASLFFVLRYCNEKGYCTDL